MDKNSELKEARLIDDQCQRNQRTCAQRARLQGQSLRKHRLDSRDRKEAPAGAGQPLHGHWAHFMCLGMQRPEWALGKEARAHRGKHCGGRRGDTRRAAHKAAYKARSAVKDPTLHKEAPHTQIKEVHPADTSIIYFKYFSTAPGGIIELKASGSGKVLGRAELNKDHITGEVIAPNVKAEEKRAHIAAGVDGPEQHQLDALPLAEHLKDIR